MNPELPPPALPPLAADPALLPAPPECLPNIDDLITEDGAPVDHIRTEKQQRLSTETLYASWAGPEEGGPFLALADVGLFAAGKNPPLVPDVMLSLGVTLEGDLSIKENRSYFLWVHGKPPDVVIEIVSDRRGGEDSNILRAYARMRVPYYVIYDPDNHLGAGPLRVFALRGTNYEPIAPDWLPGVGLGLTLWHGPYEGTEGVWLRWCDRNGQVLPTGRERAEQERQRAEQERQHAEQERQRAEQERQRAEQAEVRARQAEERAERLAAQLRALGLDPSEGS